MKLVKIILISIVQSLLFVAVSYIFIHTLITTSELISKNDAAAIGIIGGADGPTAIFFASKAYDGNPFVLSFIVSLMITSICNLSALVHNSITSGAIVFLCNLLLMLYCYLFLNYNITILLLMMLVSVILLITGYILTKAINDTP